jgi:glutathione S-transferase
LTGSLASEAALREVGEEYEIIAINIRAGEQHSEGYGLFNPTRQVPSLELTDSHSCGGENPI